MNDLPLFAFVPYVRGSDTSKAAAESMAPHVSDLEARVLSFVAGWPLGATCDEVEWGMNLAHQTASARLKGLRDKGLIKFRGDDKRKTRSGRQARVYVVCG